MIYFPHAEVRRFLSLSDAFGALPQLLQHRLFLGDIDYGPDDSNVSVALKLDVSFTAAPAYPAIRVGYAKFTLVRLPFVNPSVHCRMYTLSIIWMD